MGNASPDNRPLVGVGVVVFRSKNSKEFCMGLRKGSHGAGTHLNEQVFTVHLTECRDLVITWRPPGIRRDI
jgi:hypothetical protein